MSFWRRFFGIKEDPDPDPEPDGPGGRIVSYRDLYDELWKIWPYLYSNDLGGNLWFGDNEYYLPRLNDVRKFLRKDATDIDTYIANIRDCEDFGLKLVSRCRDYVAKQVLSGKIDKDSMRAWAIAETWGTMWDGRKTKHALCICRTSDKGWIGIKAQTDGIWWVNNKNDKPIFMKF